MRLTHDIWHQIIQYFEHEADDDDITEKRMVLLNMAVVSRLLSDLALSTLWKNMDSLHPIADVINAFAPAEEDQLLTWIDDNNHKYWKFLRKPSGDHVDLRVKEYLCRIRLLRITGDSELERALWTVLIAWFWKAEPLLPNLQNLVVYFEKGFQAPYQYVPFMVPSRLETISTIDVESFGDVTTLYQLLISQGCSLTEVEYGGNIRLPSTITQFENLHTLTVYGSYKHDRHNSPFSLPELLSQLPSLKYLDIGLGTLRTRNVDQLDPFEHLALETLLLKGTTEELQPFLSLTVICPLVMEFSLEVRFNTKLTWNFLFEKVMVILPKLKDVTIRALEPIHTPKIVLSDLHQLWPNSVEMESLVVEGVPNELCQKDLQQVLETCPKLHTLTLTGGKSPFNLEPLLSIATFQHLCTLHLPVDFIPLATPLAHLPTAVQKTLLKSLSIAPPTQFPSTFKEKIVLAQNLVILFPDLETVSAKIGGEQIEVEATNLQDTIQGMRAVIEACSG